MRLVLAYVLAGLVSAAWVLTALAQPVVLPRAHAHNDYEHARPLLDALDHGFGSVEADVHLVDGALLVGHDPEDVRPDRTLESLYLTPLHERIEQNDGRVYRGDETPLILLIDFKTEAEATYAALRDMLQRYESMLTRFEGSTINKGAVTVIVSGNRPRKTMESEAVRLAAYDGRLDDLSATPSAPAAFIPLVSSSWSTLSTWDGTGPMPSETRRRLSEAVDQAHAQGRKIRFWATPDRPEAWSQLYDAGVDLLNTDDLSGLRDFLLSEGHRSK